MRLIKFRQPIVNRDGSFKEWHYWGNISEKEWIEPAIQMHGIDTRRKSEQFTGLLDKNKKQIWEGDIINGYHNEAYGWMNYEVYFDFAHAGFWQKHTFKSGASVSGEIGYYLLKTDCICDKWEVVGNVSESPELLIKT